MKPEERPSFKRLALACAATLAGVPRGQASPTAEPQRLPTPPGHPMGHANTCAATLAEAPRSQAIDGGTRRAATTPPGHPCGQDEVVPAPDRGWVEAQAEYEGGTRQCLRGASATAPAS